MASPVSKIGFVSVLLLFLALLPVRSEDGGFLLTGSVKKSFGPGGIPLNSTAALTYDAHGRVKQALTVFEVGSPSPLRSERTTVFTYGKKGRLVSYEDELVNFGGTGFSRSMTTRTNLNEHQVQEVTFTDAGADGTLDAITTVTYTYDHHERLVSRETEIDYNADGLADILYHESWAYDLEDHKLVYTNKIDLYGDGIIDTELTQFYALDHHDNPVSFVSDPTNFAGISVYAKSGTLHYDKFGNLIETRAELLDWHDNPLGTSIETFFYERRSELIQDSKKNSEHGHFTTSDIVRGLGEVAH